MNKNAYRLKNGWLLCRCLFSITIVLPLISCQTTSKDNNFFVDQSFIIQWSYSSPLQKTPSITTPVYIKGDRLLRIDFVIPFRGNVGRFVLNKNKILIQMPLKKEFYEGAFNSQFFFPQFDSFPATWFFALLKAEPLKDWKCSFVSKNKTTCEANGFRVEWVFKNSKWAEAYLINPDQEKIKIKLLRVLRKKFKKDVFSLSLKGYKKQKKFILK